MTPTTKPPITNISASTDGAPGVVENDTFMSDIHKKNP